MKTLIVTSYPQSQTAFRRRVTAWLKRGERRWLADAARDGAFLLDLTGRHASYPAAQSLNPLDYTDPLLSGDAEAAALRVARKWAQALLEAAPSGLGDESRFRRLAFAIEAELFRVLKEFLVAVRLTEKVVAACRPQSVVCLDPAMAELFSGASAPGAAGVAGRSLAGATEFLRMAREVRGWDIPEARLAGVAGRECISFSDMASHARVLAPVIKAFGPERCALFATDAPGRSIYAGQGLSPLLPTRTLRHGRAPAELRVLHDIHQRLAHLPQVDTDPDFALLGSEWVRSQIVLLLLHAGAWEGFWQRVLDRVSPRLVLLSGAIWPSYRLLAENGRERGARTALVMHGNIPAYAPYYAQPQPDVYALFGDVYRENLERCGLSPERLVVTGCPSPAAAAPSCDARVKAGDGESPTVLFLQSPPGSELNWLDYREGVELFVRAAHARPQWRFLVKLHPHPSNNGDEIRQTLHAYGVKNVELVKDLPLVECLQRATVAVAVYSTTVLDAVSLGVPVLILRQANRKPLMPFGARGLANEVCGLSQLLAGLEAAIGQGRQPVSREALMAFCVESGENATAAVVALLNHPGTT